LVVLINAISSVAAAAAAAESSCNL